MTAPPEDGTGPSIDPTAYTDPSLIRYVVLPQTQTSSFSNTGLLTV